MFLMSLRHFQRHFQHLFPKNLKYKNLCSTHSVLNALIKSTLILLFFKKFKIQKKEK